MIDGHIVNENKKTDVPKNKKSVAYAMFFHCISTMSLIDASVNPVFDETLRRYEDWDLWMTLDKAGHKGIFCDKLLLKTYSRPNGISNHDYKDIEEKQDILFKKQGIDKSLKIADIIIPHQNRHDLLKDCLDRIDYRQFNVIIVSGGTFSENCNKGALIAETDNLIFLNDDTLPDSDILKEMVDNEADLVGVAQFIPAHNKTFYGIGYKLKSGEYLEAGLTKKPEENHIPSGYCFLVRRKMWLAMNGLDERFKNGAEDQDFGFRAIEKGYKIGYVLKPMTHLESQSEDRFKNAYENEALCKILWPEKKLIELLKLK